MKVGLIGFGRLGKLATRNLAKDTTLYVYDQVSDDSAIQRLGAKAASLKECCECPIVLLMVPISELKNLLEEMSPFIKENTLVVDVCSVKSYPIQWMEESLPSNTYLLGTHPMFGPDSAESSLYGHKIVLCPKRIEKEQLEQIKGYLEGHGLKVIIETAEEHDKQVAQSLLLTHFIGRTLIDFKASELAIDTKGHRRLMKILQTVENDSWQLFLDMNKYNPFAKEIRENFMSSMSKINSSVS